MAKTKRGPKLILLAALFGAPVLYYYHGVQNGSIKPITIKTLIPSKAEDINAAVISSNPGNVKQLPLPGGSALPQCIDGNTKNCLPGARHEMQIWAWNANMGLLLSNGGAETTKGSINARLGVDVSITRQDDTTQMKAALLSTAQQLVNNPNASGVKFVTIMGDGAGQFFHDLNPLLAKVCADCTAETVATIGYSRGEDGFWGPAEWKSNPQKARGGLVIGVLRDGDWNIAMKWAGQNGVPNNPDDTVYDPNAINWVNADSYTKAASMYAVDHYCADMPVKGNLTGQRQHVCAQAVVTWTPGDVTLATKRGGIVPILTTRQSAFQMPCILVGIRRWDRAHRDDFKKIIAAAYEAANQIRAFPAALQKAGEISAAVYKEESADYWVKYYRGVTENDLTGHSVPLGGSSVANLADGLQAFGLTGGINLFAATYTTFGKIVVQQYPKLYPDFPPVSDILDVSYVQAVRDMNTLPTDDGESQAYTHSTAPLQTSDIQGRRNYQIQFASGSATILPASFADLNQLVNDVAITKYVVVAQGYTDNAKWGTAVDSADRNQTLSAARAESVKAYLGEHGVRNVIRTQGHGEEDPVADNATPAGRALNRRVQILLGSTN